MTKRFEDALKVQKKNTLPNQLEIYGTLGIPIGGERLVEVPNRPAFVYVKLRDNQNEVVQAFNNKVAASYGLPVILRREGNRYIVLGVNTQRYQNNWNNWSPYLPKHGTAHSFSETGGGGDTTWVFSRQFMPLLVYPSTSTTGTNVQVGGQGLLANGNWRYVGNTGTIDLLGYKPTGGDGSIMVLVYLDVNSGNPGILVGSGTQFSNNLTGAGNICPYIPVPNLGTQIPLSAIRLSTGTNRIGWGDLYDVRQWLHPQNSGTSSGGGGVSDGFGIVGLDEGILLGTGAYLNVVGDGATLTISGSMLQLTVPGGGSSGLPIYNQGIPIVTGTAIDFTGNVYVTASGTRARVDFPVTTYFRVGQPDYLSNPTGLYWRVPDRVYASGSLGVFVGGHALIPGVDYLESLYVSGTYQYLIAQPTGSYHLVHYGVPCYPQPFISSESSLLWLTDSEEVLLTDSDGIQLTDSDG